MSHTEKIGFQFRQFFVGQQHCAMKVGTDGVLLGAWATGGHHILDIGTGTGVVALMMAQRFPSADIDAIEVDHDAAEQATDNVRQSPFASRVTVTHTALQNFHPSAPYDSIVCNPPYFLNSLKAPEASRSLARHAGDDSLTFRDIFVFAKANTTDTGVVNVVVPTLSQEALETEAYLLGFRKKRELLLRTTPRKPLSRVLVTFSRSSHSPAERSEQCLMNADGSRSAWYQQLTADFYVK
ncbi:tRNA1(Val) (adenine(37)-N6)-methyltransferase [Hallella absiana]|uniref:tRNA1(Val) (adenine(37)-N6)-methyltransferase n=1 Tax=Hallella absiana TaxID=2925336 RepID=UPI0021CA72A7|nr:methyltransferase [Hallella absiana]